MAAGLEVRVPFADHRLVEYVFNVPWEIKFKNGVEKALLREAMKEFLPDQILNRKKSPYPKTHNPLYEKLVFDLLKKRLNSGSGILPELLCNEESTPTYRSGGLENQINTRRLPAAIKIAIRSFIIRNQLRKWFRTNLLKIPTKISSIVFNIVKSRKNSSPVH